MTVALVGEAFPAGTDPGIRVATFQDENVPPYAEPLKVRFINAVPNMPLVSFGTGSQGAVGTYNEMFPAVPFGQASAAVERDATVSNADDDGYIPIQTFNQTVLSVHVTGSATDAFVTKMPVSANAGVTMTVIGVGGTSSGTPVSLLACFDSAAPTGPLSECTSLP
jgi:hypothetical protein